MELVVNIVAVLAAVVVVAYWVWRMHDQVKQAQIPTIRSEDYDVIVEAGRYKGRCLIPGCGWFTANWVLDRSAKERIKLHLREHATGEPMPPLSTMSELH